VGMFVCAFAMVCTWRPEDNLKESILFFFFFFFNTVGPGAETQVI
jgi:hypothetical protein